MYCKKLNYPAPAKELYCSDNFKKLLKIAGLQKADVTLVLSALHHVVDLDTVIAPYDCTLVGASIKTKKDWSKIVSNQLKERFNLEEDEFIIYTPKDYNYFIDNIKNKTLPLKGLSQGRRAKRINEILTELISKKRAENE